ncbi:hypothetical protein ACRN91_14295 [Shewanella baltica]|uniref:hypothetical protein n=1 Tax=Shewanella baltica TaxID=62322 RepID=UPI003D7B6A52
MQPESNSTILYFLCFLTEHFFKLSENNDVAEELLNSIRNDLLKSAAIADGCKVEQVYFCKLSVMKALVSDALIADHISKGESVRSVSSRFDISVQRTYRACKKHGVKPKKAKNNGCYVYRYLRLIENELVKLMTSEGMSSRQIEQEFKINSIG